MCWCIILTYDLSSYFPTGIWMNESVNINQCWAFWLKSWYFAKYKLNMVCYVMQFKTWVAWHFQWFVYLSTTCQLLGLVVPRQRRVWSGRETMYLRNGWQFWFVSHGCNTWHSCYYYRVAFISSASWANSVASQTRNSSGDEIANVNFLWRHRSRTITTKY